MREHRYSSASVNRVNFSLAPMPYSLDNPERMVL